MQKEKVLNFLKNKGTLGVLTLCLVGATAFATYQVSYQERQQILQSETEDKLADLVQEENKAAENLEVSAREVKAELTTEDTLETTQETSGMISREEAQEQSEKTVDAGSINVEAQIQPTVNFQEESTLAWPAAGTVLMDYNMNGTVYFKTLNQYKYNPALIISSEVGNQVVASAKGIVESIGTNEETGTTLTLNLGNDYSLVYGQLKEVAVSEGEVVEQGQLLGYVSEPTKYYCEEGSNLYFQMKKDGQPVDPFLFLE